MEDFGDGPEKQLSTFQRTNFHTVLELVWEAHPRWRTAELALRISLWGTRLFTIIAKEQCNSTKCLGCRGERSKKSTVSQQYLHAFFLSNIVSLAVHRAYCLLTRPISVALSVNSQYMFKRGIHTLCACVQTVEEV